MGGRSSRGWIWHREWGLAADGRPAADGVWLMCAQQCELGQLAAKCQEEDVAPPAAGCGRRRSPMGGDNTGTAALVLWCSGLLETRAAASPPPLPWLSSTHIDTYTGCSHEEAQPGSSGVYSQLYGEPARILALAKSTARDADNPGVNPPSHHLRQRARAYKLRATLATPLPAPPALPAHSLPTHCRPLPNTTTRARRHPGGCCPPAAGLR